MSALERFQRKKEHQVRVDALLELFKEYHHGDLVPWFEVEQVIGIDRKEWRAMHAIKRARNELLRGERGFVLRVMDGGLYILTPPEQVQWVAAMRNKKVRSQCNKKLNEVGAAPEDGLTEHQRRLKHHELDRAEEVRTAVLRGDRLAKTLMAPTETIPQRPRTETRA